MSFFEELKRRNVFRVGIAYVLMGWVLLQAADFALDLVDAPNWVIQVFFIAVVIGLPIALFFAWAFEVTPEGIKREAEVDRTQSITPTTGRKLDRSIIAFLALAVVLLLAKDYIGGPSEPDAPGTDAKPQAVIGSAKSIAVLPFADLSQAQDQGWFADGLAEEILNALTRVPDLQVSARTSTFQYRDTTKDVATIGQELGVAHILEGSVRSAGDRIRVTAQLIRATDGFHLWSENYDRDVADMISIQEDLASSIAVALETTMDPEALAEMARVGTQSIEAYQEYLRGLQFQAQALTESEGTEAFDKAYLHFENARELDPGFADAHVQASDYWKVQLSPTRTDTGSSDLEPLEALREYHERIGLGIQNADSEADKMRSVADRAFVDLRLGEAARLFRDYLEIRPNDEQARFEYYGVASMLEDKETLRTLLEHWKEKGKTSNYAASAYINDAYRTVDPSEAADFGLEALQRWPNSNGLLYQTHRTLLWAGRFSEASQLAARYAVLVPGSNPLVLAREACAAGDREAAEQILADLNADRNNFQSSIWLLHNMLGNTREETETLRYLEDTGVPFSLASFLSYHKFDPRPFPGLMAVLEREGVERSPPAIPPFRCPPPDETSIAVLPFVNMSSDPEQEYFSDGISEEILNGLVKLEDLKVAGRTSSFSFKGQNQDLRAIGEALGVNHILEGSVRKAGDQVRITAQLVQVSDGFHLWSETYTRELNDIFAVQDEISQAIVEALEVTLSPEEEEQLASRPTENVEAYNKYLQGRQLWHQRGGANLKLAAEALQEAVTLDPEFALAWAALADAYVLIPEYNLGNHESGVWIPRARDAVNRALELNPGMAQALTTRGYIRYQYDFDWDNAEKDILTAIKNEPTYPTAHQWYGEMLAARDRDIEGGLASIRKGAELDPLAPIMWHVSGSLTGEFERFEEATQYYNRVLEISPNFIPTHNNLTWLYVRTGEYKAADEMWDRFQELTGLEFPEGVPNIIDAAQDPVARQEFLEIMNTDDTRSVSAINKSNFYMFLGEHELAIESLIEAKANGDPYAVTANRMKIFDPLRDDPRFIEHLESMNIKP